MDISVVIPFYSNVAWLYDAINSIKEPDSLKYEIVVINDGSNEQIEADKIGINVDKIRIINQKNQGSGVARNRGIEEAEGEYIAFLDSDDLFLKGKLTKQLKFMKDNDFQWSHSMYIKFYEDKSSREFVDNSFFSGNVFPKCFAYNPIATPTVMVKKSALENPKKRFSENMKHGQDGFMWSQLAASYPLGVLPEYLSLVRMRGSNTSLKAVNHLYARSKIYKYMKRMDLYYNNKNIPFFLKYLNGLASIDYNFIKILRERNIKEKNVEIIAKFLFLPIFAGTKIYYFASK